ncbi:trigger factor [Megasphaera cerevisiae DSM 20462]|uniref:Trigger factor n=1 Tax=Megasphaera cerevisiae DSM 20462 TaxID=1122219 RepID=A0A0J6WY35_9FIRM|nr:trigger factor [Megasphaera cerevisiae]KMO86772.1 trigger factor [Megasphaera cerevisiae DSM 20462]SJZ35151.1 trigger factor [Megasphaera cerevisiae DSM 20462]
MNVTVNEVDQHKITLHIEVPVKEASKASAAACKNLAGRVNIPGFRKGKAPRMVLESFLGKDAVKQEVFEAIANKAYSDALKEKDIIPVADPDIKVISDEKGKDVVFEATVIKKPKVKLGEYKGIKLAKDVISVTDEDVSKELANLQKQHSKLVIAPEGTEIAKDDFAVIDFNGSVEGVPFEGGEGKSYPLQIGSGSFIPGFEDQIIGCKAGDEKDVKVTFPEDYFEKKLAGKEAVFAVKINDVKRSELPAINDEFAKEAGKFDTIDELKADIRKRLESKASFQALEKFNSEVLKTAVNAAEVDIPQIMVDDKIDQMIEELSMKLETQRMNLDDYLKYMHQDMDKLKEQYIEPAKENVKMDLVLEAIAKAENIEVKDIDLQAEIITMAQNFGADPKEVYKIILKEHRVPMLVQSVGRKKAASFILKNAVNTNEDTKGEEPNVEQVKAEDKPEA